MADDNVDLNFLAAQLGKVLDGQREMLADLGEMQIALAATRADFAIVKGDVSTIRETLQNQGARLNAIDGRLALIEKHTGLVKA
jgi:hypothetical protein